MNKIETIQEFYKRKHGWLSDNIRNEIGHFNVFNLDPFVGDKAKPVPYKDKEKPNLKIFVLRKKQIGLKV